MSTSLHSSRRNPTGSQLCSPSTSIATSAKGSGNGQWVTGGDRELLEIVTSANIACGFHAGDPSIMRRTCELAVAFGVAIGAHVAYPDLVGFGRRFVDIAADELRDAVTYQIGALQAIAAAAGGSVAYVKPHGALYNTIVTHEAQAAAVRCLRMVTERTVTSISGHDITLNFDSHCVHGDTAEAVQIALAVRHTLAAAGVTLQSFIG